MARFKWWLTESRDVIRGSSDAKLVLALGLVVLLGVGGYFAAARVSRAGAGTTGSSSLVRVVRTVRVPVKVRVHGRTVLRWRVRREVVKAQPQTVMQTQTLQTPGGTKVITRPFVTYRTKVVRSAGKTHTVVMSRTITASQTVTDAQTSTVSRTQTVLQTVTNPVTVVQTQTVTNTVTLPGTTVTVTVP